LIDSHWSHKRQPLVESIDTIATGVDRHDSHWSRSIDSHWSHWNDSHWSRSIDSHWSHKRQILEPQTTDTGATSDNQWSHKKQQPMEPRTTDTGGAMNDRRYWSDWWDDR